MFAVYNYFGKIETFYVVAFDWLSRFRGYTYMILHHYESIISGDGFLAVSFTDHQSVFPRFPIKHTRYMVCLWHRNTRDYSTSMRACGPENGSYALLEELADCIERNAIEYADINQQTHEQNQ